MSVFQSTRLSRASTLLLYSVTDLSKFQSTRLSRASTAKIHNYPCIHAKFIYLNYTPSTNHPASQKIFSYFNPIFRPFAVRNPWNFMCNYYSHQSFLTKNQPSFKLPPLSLCAKFSRTILNNHLKWRSQLTVYPAVYYVLSRSKNSKCIYINVYIFYMNKVYNRL